MLIGEVIKSSSVRFFFSSANDFVGLGDTPAGYGSVGQSVVVGADGSSLVFSGVAGG